jgi:hypothetical protein
MVFYVSVLMLAPSCGQTARTNTELFIKDRQVPKILIDVLTASESVYCFRSLRLSKVLARLAWVYRQRSTLPGASQPCAAYTDVHNSFDLN